MDEHKNSMRKAHQVVEELQKKVGGIVAKQAEFQINLKANLQKQKDMESELLNQLTEILLVNENEYSLLLKTLSDFVVLMKDALNLLCKK